MIIENNTMYNSTLIENQLNLKIENAMSIHSYTTAIFFSDKLLNLVKIHSKRYIETLYTLCDALYCDKQFQRSSYTIQKYLNSIQQESYSDHYHHNHHEDNEDDEENYKITILKLKYLAAKCKIETNEYDVCLQILRQDDDDNNTNINNNNNNNNNNKQQQSNNNNDEDDGEDDGQLLKFYTKQQQQQSQQPTIQQHTTATTNNKPKESKSMLIIKSSIATIKGKCFEAMDNLKKSKYWYTKALLLDYNCFEAFEALTKNHLLTYQEEIQLLEKLNFLPEDLWIKEIYSLSLKKYDSPKFTFNYKYLELYDTLNNNNNNNGNGNNSVISTEDLISSSSNNDNNNNNNNLSINEIRKRLIECNDILTWISEYYFYRHQFQESYSITKKILKHDKYYNNSICLIVNISSMFELQLTNELYFMCHQLVDSFPNLNGNGNGGNGQIIGGFGNGGLGSGSIRSSAISWYGIACYYQLISNSDQTQRFFTKSTTLDNRIGASWLGFGHFFASKGEHDQAMAAYRTSSRLLTGCHLPLLCIGMELIRVHNLNLASQYILQAKDICPYDPIIFNELGIIEYKNGQYQEAIKHFETTLEISKIKNDDKKSSTSKSSSASGKTTSTSVMMSYLESWEPTIYNLAHCYRKLQKFEIAIHYYTMSLSLLPNNPSTFSALGFTHHLLGNFDEAIDYYHQSLSIRDDTFTNVLLHKALSLSILKYD